MTLENAMPMDTNDESPVESDAAEPITGPVDDQVPSESADPETISGQADAPETEDEQLDRAIAELGPASASTILPAAADDVLVGVDDPRDSVSSWPFAAYVTVWILFAGLVLWRFYEVPVDSALYEVDAYRWVVVAGIALTALGPILSLIVWAVAMRAHDAERWALFVSALFKGALATFVGVCIWWGSLLVLDQLRMGSLL